MMINKKYSYKFESHIEERLIISLDEIVDESLTCDEILIKINIHLQIFKDYFNFVRIGTRLYNIVGDQVIALAQTWGYKIILDVGYYRSIEKVDIDFPKYCELGLSMISISSKCEYNIMAHIKEVLKISALSLNISIPTLLVDIEPDYYISAVLGYINLAGFDGLICSNDALSYYNEDEKSQIPRKYFVLTHFDNSELSTIGNIFNNGGTHIILGYELLNSNTYIQHKTAQRIYSEVREVIEFNKIFA